MRTVRPLALWLLLAAAAAGWSAAPAAGASATSVVNGTIAALGADSITVAAEDGSQHVAQVGPDTYILSRSPATLRTIKAGDPLAITASRAADGSLTAVSISILSPALWNRARKGQWPMDSGNIMTNAQVTQVVGRVAGRTLYMQLDQGTKVISVPNAAEIHQLKSVSLSALKPGMRVTLRGAADPNGATDASSIVFDQP
jgi:Domain of unknown function (DUF5666)